MAAFGEILEEGEIDALVQYVLAISGQDHDAALAGESEALFLDACASCHGEDGTGMRDLGAPTCPMRSGSTAASRERFARRS